MVYWFALFCALILGGLASASVRASGGRADNPATLLCGIWAIILGIYWLSGDSFYAAAPSTIILLTLAPIAFFIGATLSPAGTPTRPSSTPPQKKTYLRIAVVVWTGVLLLCLPAYFNHFAEEISGDSEINLIAAIRMVTLENEGEPSEFSPIRNLLPFSYALPLIALLAFDGDRLKAILMTLLAAALAACYGLLTGSKSVVPSLAVSICVVLVAKNNGKVRGSGALTILASGVIGFLVLMRYVSYTFDEANNEYELWAAAARGTAAYLCAPIVGLNFHLISPEYYDLDPQNISRPFYYIANSILHQLGHPPLRELPSLHLQFFRSGPGSGDTYYNTYSYLGTYIQSTNQYLFLIFPFALGLLLSRFHRFACSGSIFALSMYAYIARALPLSFNGELLILDIANIFKFAVVVWIMTSLTPAFIAKTGGWLRVPRASSTT